MVEFQNFCPPPKVCAQDELQAHIYETFRFNHIRQMVHMVDADFKSLVLALVKLRAGWAHAGLCHVYSTVYSS